MVNLITLHFNFETTKDPHPEVEFVPRLFLRVDAVRFGPADSPDICLMALFEVDKLEEEDGTIKNKV